MIAFKFRLYPNKEQISKLDFTIEMCRQTYNMMLSELRDQVIIDRAMIQAMLPDLKICEPKFKKVYAKALHYECHKLFSNLSTLCALKKKGMKIGRLRFKGKNWFKTFNYNQHGFKLVKTGKRFDKLVLSKIGSINIRCSREVDGRIKHITVKKSIDKWFATIITDGVMRSECGSEELGIDLGLDNFIVDSEGKSVVSPKVIKKFSSKLRWAHKSLSRKKKGSKNRLKAKLFLAKVYEKVVNVREDFLHKVSTSLVKRSKLIVLEDLQIKNMVRNHHFAKSISDVSWGKFISFLTYKVESTGCKIIKVNPKNTSKMCSNCGGLQDMPLHKRVYKCENCGLELDRDYNSAINILRLGLEQTYVEIPTSTPLEQVGSMKQEAITLTQGVEI